jgi:hypothetical protein
MWGYMLILRQKNKKQNKERETCKSLGARFCPRPKFEVEDFLQLVIFCDWKADGAEGPGRRMKMKKDI